MQRKPSAQTKFSHLIADAVSHAVVRRNQVEMEESLTTLSDDEVRAIMGGQTSAAIVIKSPVVIAGNMPFPKPEEVI